ncbi:MAG: selenosugar synthase SenB [Deltaproteobacteria bacterium]|nr:selenosugar synthase SenB [Deltaproteobacteria bacterium]
MKKPLAFIVTPAPAGSRLGNRVTANRWAGILRGLGWRVKVAQTWEGQPADLLIALHARKSHSSVARWAAQCPGRPLLVALTGTDLYQDLPNNPQALESLALAGRLVALNRLAERRLPAENRPKLRVILQSAQPGPAGSLTHSSEFHRSALPGSPADSFDVLVVGHLRPEKDPFRAALAARLLPAASRIRVWQLGRAIAPGMAQAARTEETANPRYVWLGTYPHREILRRMAQADLLVLSSRMEGGANVLSEAAVVGLPVLASAVEGNLGLLGEDYPGLFPLEDTQALAGLLERAEGDPAFLGALRAAMARLAPQVTPQAEREGWRSLLAEWLSMGKGV